MSWNRIGKAIMWTAVAISIFLMLNLWFFAFVLKSDFLGNPWGKTEPKAVQIQKVEFVNIEDPDPNEIAAKIQVEIDSLNSWLQLGEDYPNMYIYTTWIDGLQLRFATIEGLYKHIAISDQDSDFSNTIERYEEARDRILFGVQRKDQIMINIGREILNEILNN